MSEQNGDRFESIVDPLRVLVACESSGTVRDAFNRLGHVATSCDLLDTETPGDHYKGDVRDIIDNEWDIIIAHPPCTYLNIAAAWAFQDPDFDKFPGVGYHQKVKPGTLVGESRRKTQSEALDFVRMFMNANCPRIAIENPVGAISTKIRKADQYIQPHQFGENASKKTGLWLKGWQIMKYMGSKNRIAKHILPIMLAERKPDQWWVEPFVGGANMIDKVQGNRIGNDSHEFLISLLIALRDGYVPPTNISKELYYAIKSNPQGYPKELVGFVGFLCSFGGKWWGGYAFDKKGNNYADRGSRVLTKQAKNFSEVVFRCGDYLDMEIPPNSLIYCDPPYENTTKYKDSFNHTVFWQWCRDKVRDGHTVFISEYSAPSDFICVKEIQHKTILDKNSQYPRIEKLFRYKT